MRCSGDETQYCGAGNRLELYSSTAEPPPSTTATPAPKPTVSSYIRVGCYEEVPGRALNGRAFADDAMTLEMCADACSEFPYWAAEYGRECYCGNALAAGCGPADDDADCNMPCAGDRQEYCGASDRLELYYSNTTSGPSQPPTVAGGYAWFGCWSEAAAAAGAARTLAAKSFADNALTLDSCAAFCEGFVFFGAEYGRECYCGNVLSGDAEEKGADECGMVCAGDKKQFCGAGNRLSIYELSI